MTRQNTILSIVGIVAIIIIGALVLWPETVEEPAEPVATTEEGGTAATDATAPTEDESPTAEAEAEEDDEDAGASN